MITAAAAGAAIFLPSISSFHHRARLRPCPRRRLAVALPARATTGSSSSSSSSWEEREEARWLREEQRWLREEQRWLREESRWRAEREALLAEVAALRLRLRALEASSSPHHIEAVDAVASPAPPAAIPAPQPRPVLVEEEVEVRKEVVVEEKTTKAAAPPKADETKGSGGKRRTLRTGAEGEDVRALQEALLKLGFYSGEEDMEYSSFSTDTERAVKTWQATVGTSEDGVMTSELLEILFSGKTGEDVKTTDDINGAAAPAVTGIAEVRQTMVTENGALGVSEHRVFLLGENRWEDPSRLTQKKPTSTPNGAPTKTCVSCRGEGRLMCTECDGTGQPNVEPQFLEWVGEDTKCPYCEGLGSIVCDVCDGKTVVAN
ncbi:hypothetical protein PR202_ga19696 [Eleusine coracana subsp. coracana]|uniref:Peptidoglycan binding-like domain-containing protein n=1 Tax=Eleusine coracana subsp. coracana TaxID=191504 RepID=A0AAV5CWE2_ELECO|nr:hypothetical protein QOZ80_4AG0310780 [Eleusine coracana subsp. coracana]GJN02355.1 hypothetical protein PR202_ga19696 [Eleusine coracana subsp. coracana]